MFYVIKYVNQILKNRSIDNQWNRPFLMGFNRCWIYKSNLYGYYFYKENNNTNILNFELNGRFLGLFSVLNKIKMTNELQSEQEYFVDGVLVSCFSNQKFKIFVFEKNGFIYRCKQINNRCFGTVVSNSFRNEKINICELMSKVS